MLWRAEFGWRRSGSRLAEEMADRIGIIHQGRLTASGSPDAVRRQRGATGRLE